MAVKFHNQALSPKVLFLIILPFFNSLTLTDLWLTTFYPESIADVSTWSWSRSVYTCLELYLITLVTADLQPNRYSRGDAAWWSMHPHLHLVETFKSAIRTTAATLWGQRGPVKNPCIDLILDQGTWLDCWIQKLKCLSKVMDLHP